MTANLTLIRGIPGSGKSTLAQALTQNGGTHLEADMFFVDDAGNYKYDADRVAEAHDWCRSETRRFLKMGFFVVVSNTFTREREINPYRAMAIELNVPIQEIICMGNFGSIHGVPQEQMARFRSRAWWLNTRRT